jgi:phosphoribosylamine--glycine ligase
MKLLLVGGGGREHAILHKLKENPEVKEVYVLPGNGGMEGEAICVPIKATDVRTIAAFAKEKAVDFAVVAPDDPLCLGLVDLLREEGIPAFGPDRKAAIIEGSKVFSKNLMKKYGIPTAAYETFDNAQEALYCLHDCKYPIVIKADGLALGKGVLICNNKMEAEDAIHTIMEEKIFGSSGSQVVMEEFLSGPEVSVLCFTDGKTIKPMVSSMDHKRALDFDRGLNTGGMGAVAPNPYYTKEMALRCMREIFLPTVDAMNQEGRTFRGCLYFGLMLTEDGPKVIEYNCRFGDPETQAVLPLLKSDLLTIMKSTVDGTLDRTNVSFSSDASCCVILSSGGYPKAYETGKEIKGLDAPKEPDVYHFHAGTKRLENGITVTSGGRVLGVTAIADTLDTAVSKAYRACEAISFENMHMRHDIGQRALNASKR